MTIPTDGPGLTGSSVPLFAPFGKTDQTQFPCNPICTIMTIDHQLVFNEVKDYVTITFGLLMYACCFTIFLMPYQIVTGGVTGLSALIFYVTGFKLEWTYMIINISLLVVALRILGIKFMMKTIYAIFALYFMLKYAQELMPVDKQGHFIMILGKGQEFMSMVVGCCLTGTSLAIVFLSNGSTGGSDIIAACINKYRDISLGQALTVMDVFIVGSCFLFPEFGDISARAHKVVNGLCTIVVEMSMLDFVYNRRRSSVQFMIYSRKHEEIADILSKETDHGLTILDGHGWYTGQEIKVICLLARKNESQLIFRLIKMTDPNAFVSQSAVIGVYGEGFDKIKVKVKKKHEDRIRNQQQA